MENIHTIVPKPALAYINCIVEPVEDYRAQRSIEFALLGKPIIHSLDMYTGELTVTLWRNADHLESTYSLYYFVDNGWKVIRYNRLGLPESLETIVSEIIHLAHSFVDDDNEEDEVYRFNHELADELIERVSYFRRHVQLTARYKRAKDIVQFDTIG